MASHFAPHSFWRSEGRISTLLLIPNTLFQIQAPTHALNSGSIARWFGPKKLVISKSPAGASRSPAMKLLKSVPACETTFSLRVLVKFDRTSVFATTTGAGALRSGFSLDAIIPPGRSEFIIEARSSNGPWEIFFVHPVRGAIFRDRSDADGETAGNYARWIRCYDHLQRDDLECIRKQIAQFHYSPLISILLPVYNSNLKWLRRAILSVQKQSYPRWELCIVDDASTDRKIWPFLQRCARRDQRIKVIRRTENGHISAASNDALRLATGNYVALLDHDDELAPTALYFVALALNKNRDLQLLYSDEDKLDERNQRSEPYFKSDWNPDLFLAQNFVSHLRGLPNRFDPSCRWLSHRVRRFAGL